MKRPAVAEDEACIVSMWLSSYAFAREVKPLHPGAELKGSTEQVAFWRLYQPIVTGLVRLGEVTVLCDPERSEHTEDSPAVLWGWACTSGPLVHYVGIKRSALKAGLGQDMLADLLGSKLGERCTTTFELVDLYPLKLIPAGWRKDSEWLANMRQLSRWSLERENISAAVAGHIVDPQREPWQRKSDRVKAA